METFKITFYRNEEKETRVKTAMNEVHGETVEFMAANENEAILIFQQAEPFAVIVKVEQL